MSIYLINKYEEPKLNSKEIQAVVNLSPTTPNTHPDIAYHRIADASRISADSRAELAGYKEAGEFIHQQHNQGNNVAVHCNNGYQRSIPFLAWYLHAYYDQPIETTVESCLDSIQSIDSRQEYASMVAKLLKNP